MNDTSLNSDVENPDAAAWASQRTSMILEHRNLVLQLAHRLARQLPPNVELNDLIQAGMLGLVEAGHRYSPRKNATFRTYAWSRVRGAILESLRKGDWTPRSVYRWSREIRRVVAHIENQTSGAARPTAVAAALGLPLEVYYRIASDSVTSRVMSADQQCPEVKVSYLENVPDERANPAAEVENAQLLEALTASIEALPEQERTVILLHYEASLRLRDIGDKLELSESRICQICARAIARLRSSALLNNLVIQESAPSCQVT